MPRGTVFRNRDLERVASGSARIVDKEESPIGEPDGVDARTWVGQRRCRHPSPRTAAVIRSRLCDDALSAATQDLQATLRSEREALAESRRTRSVSFSGAERSHARGSAMPSAVQAPAKPLHVNDPAVVLGAGAGQHHARGNLHRLCANRTEDPLAAARSHPTTCAPRRATCAQAPTTHLDSAQLCRTTPADRSSAGTAPDSSTGTACHPAARRWRPRPASTRRRPHGVPPRCRRQDSFPCVPPNHAATRPSRVSTIVEACADGNGARSKTNSDWTMAGPESADAERGNANHRERDERQPGDVRCQLNLQHVLLTTCQTRDVHARPAARAASA